MNWRKQICRLMHHKWEGCLCIRCGETDSHREPHSWSVCRCTRCTATRHGWSNWEYEKDSTCRQRKNCTRCDELQTRYDHEFEYKMKDTCTGERTCRRCRTTELVEEHSFEIEGRDMYDVEYDMNNLVCTKCGLRTFETFKVL